MAKTSLVLNALTLVGLTFGLSLSQAAVKEKIEPVSCQQTDPEAFINCLNQVVVTDQLEKSQATFTGIAGRLAQSHDLSAGAIQKSFNKAYSTENDIPAIEVGSTNYEAADEGVDFAPYGYTNKSRAIVIENNIRRTMNFAAWFHARSFGRTSSMLFSFRRVEIQASKHTGLGMTLKDKTLLVSLPQNRLITTKEMIDFWNSGRVLVPSDVSQYPMQLIKFFAKFGEQGILGEKVLEYWKFINPVGEFRVGLHALYLAKVVEARNLIERENLSQEDKNRMVSFLDNPIETAKSLDSLFSMGSTETKKGVVIVNRTTGFCPIKVSNSHVINVSVKASRFESAANAPTALTVKTENGSTVVESDGSVPVHIVNDKTYAGLVCVDTHDNIDVSLEVVFGQLEQQLSPETLVQYAQSFAL